MNSSRIFIALAVLAALAVAVVMTVRSREAKTTVEAPPASATIAAPKKEEIEQLEITRPNEAPIVLTKSGDSWRLTAPVDAEASQAAVDAALDKLAELQITGVAATRKENHERLEVDPAHGIHVQARGDKPLLNLWVGSSKSSGTMVRIDGQDQVLSAKGSFKYVFNKEPKEFRKREITELDSADLTALTLSSDKGAFKFVREGDDWTQAKGEKPIAKFDPSQVQAIASTVANLRAQDFAAPGEGSAVTGLDAPRARVGLTKKDGSTVEVLIGKPSTQGDDYYVRTSQGDVVYRLAKFSAERLMPDAKFFEKSDKPAAPAAGAAPTGMPPMMGGPGGGGQISPEMMQQIQRQLQAQGHGGGHP